MPITANATDESQPLKPVVAGGGRRDHDSDAATSPFAAFLAITAAPPLPWPEGQGRFSPEQMFESPVENAHERRQAQLKAEDRSARLPGATDPRLEPTGVDARRAARAALPGRPEGVFDAYSSGIGRPGNAGSKGSDASIPSAAASSRETAAPPAPPRTGRIATTSAMDSARINLPEPSLPAPVISGRVAATDAPSPGPVAQCVAEVLAGGRTGNAEAGRSVTSVAEPPAAGPQAMGQKNVTSVEKSPAQVPAERPSPERATERTPSDFDKLVRSIRMQLGTRHSSARLHLEPPELGRIRVDVRMNGRALEIGVRAETIDARNVLAERAAALRAALEHHGISVERLDISVDTPTGRDAGFDAPDGTGGSVDAGGEGPVPHYSGRASPRESAGPGTEELVPAEENAPTLAAARLDIRA